MKISKKIEKGFTLIEILVVITIFSVLTILVTQTIIFSLRSTKKSESLNQARQNLDYAAQIVERHIRNADRIETCSGSPVTSISYYDAYGIASSFSCVSDYVASGSYRLTSQ